MYMSIWTPVKDEMLGYLFKLAQYIQDPFIVAEHKVWPNSLSCRAFIELNSVLAAAVV